MAPRRAATVKKNETPEQWRLKLINATEDEVMKAFGYEDLKEWHEVQIAEDERKAEEERLRQEAEAEEERLRLEKEKDEEDERLRKVKEKEDRKRKAAEAADKEGNSQGAANRKGKQVAEGEKTGKKRRGGSVGAEDERGAKRVKVDEERCANCIKAHEEKCVVESGKKSCSYCVRRKIGCDRAAGGSVGPAIDPELLQAGVEAQESTAALLRSMGHRQHRMEASLIDLEESVDDVRTELQHLGQLLKIGLRMAYGDEAEAPLSTHEQRVDEEWAEIKRSRETGARSERAKYAEERQRTGESGAESEKKKKRKEKQKDDGANKEFVQGSSKG